MAWQRYKSYTQVSNGLTNFAYTWEQPDESIANLRVQLKPVATGISNTLIEGPDYTVAGRGIGGGGSITLIGAFAAGLLIGDVITLESILNPGQFTAFTTPGSFSAEAVNNEFQRRVLALEDEQRLGQRSLKLPPMASEAVDTELPEPAANNALGWNATADKIVNLPASAASAVTSTAVIPDEALVVGDGGVRGIKEAALGAITVAGADKVVLQDVSDSDIPRTSTAQAIANLSGLQVFDAFNNGASLDSTSVVVTSNGTVITLALEKSGGGDVRFPFSDGIHTHDCTPADSIALTAGSDASPQINFIYIPQSTKVLTLSTSSFPNPSVEFAPIATVFCQSAASLQPDGAYKVHVWTDHISNGNGHLSHLNRWIRERPAGWLSGVALTPTDGAATLDVATSSGSILQLHPHTYPAFDTSTGDEIYVVNDPDVAYTKVANLTQAAGVDKDANGVALGAAATDHYNLVIWGVVSESTGDCKLMCNLPSGSYNNNNGNQATDDTSLTAVYTIPSDYVGTGFLIARLTIQENAGTYTVLQNQDLRGSFPSTSAGGSASGSVTFADNVFRIQDDGDITKEIAFQAVAIATGTVRTITMPDADVNLGAVAVNTAKLTANETNVIAALDGAAISSAPLITGLDKLLLQDQSASDALYVSSVQALFDLLGRSRIVEEQTGATFAPALGDEDKYFLMNRGTTMAVTIPANASVAFAIGTEMHFEQVGAGEVTFAITTDTLIAHADYQQSLKTTDGPVSVVTLKKKTATTWTIFGKLLPA